MRAKSEIFTVSPRTFEQKCKGQGRENISNALHGPHLSIKEDMPGSALAGRKPSTQKDTELKFWLRCRGDSCE